MTLFDLDVGRERERTKFSKCSPSLYKHKFLGHFKGIEPET